MFLLPSLLLGVLFALLLGGRPSRLLSLELRHGWVVFASLGLQIVLFSPLGADVPAELREPLHLATYGLLGVFALVNARTLVLLPIFLGMACNAVAIAVNGGRMPVHPDAAAAAGIDATAPGNTRLGGDALTFLGDVFALPSSIPFANVFSAGDLLIGFGMIALIVAVSTREDDERRFVLSRLGRPLESSAFRRLAIGKLVSHLGDWLTVAALVGWVYQETGSTTQVAILMLIRLGPPVLGGALAAAVIDWLPKIRLLLVTEILRGAAVGGALAAVLLENRTLAFAAMAASGVLAAVSAATVRALVPSLLEEEFLPAANAGLGIAQDAAMGLGALAAGITLSASNAATALGVDLVTFAVASVLYWGIRAVPAPMSEPGERGVLKGLRHLGTRPILLVVIAAFCAATLATGLINATLPRLLDRDLGLGAGAYGFGLAALAVGLTVGQAVVGLTRVGPSGGRWIGAGLMVMSGFVLALGLTSHAPTALLLLALIGLVDGATDVLFDTIVQREADPRFYGRVFGIATAFMTATMMGAVGMAPLVNGIAPAHQVIFVAGLVLLGASAIALLGTRSKRTAEKAQEPEPVPDAPPAAVLQLVPSPEPEAEPEPEPEPEREKERPHRVVLRLGDGERVLVGVFESFEAARAEAQAVTRYVVSLGEDEWPFFDHRFIRPETIVSVDLAEEVAVTERRSDSVGG
jgi:hypothetical protein